MCARCHRILNLERNGIPRATSPPPPFFPFPPWGVGGSYDRFARISKFHATQHVPAATLYPVPYPVPVLIGR